MSQLIHYIAGLTQLQRLILKECYLLNDRALGYLSSLVNLKYLNLRKCNITNNGMHIFTALTNLTHLNLSCNPMCTKMNGLSYVAQLPQLKRLNLEDCLTGNKGFEYIAELTNLTELSLATFEDHDVFTDSISEVGLKFISRLKNLQKLDLTGCYFVNDVVIEIIGKLTNLKALGLQGCSITDIGFSSITKLTNLTSLDMANTPAINHAMALAFTSLDLLGLHC